PPDRSELSGRHPPLLNGQPCPSVLHAISEGVNHDAYEDSLTFTRPAFPSLWFPDSTGTLGHFRGLRTTRLPRSHAAAGERWTLARSQSHDHLRSSNRCNHSQHATSRRTSSFHVPSSAP